MSEIRAATVLPARREPVTLRTADGLSLVGELACPPTAPPVATLICLHPLPTHGGMMDSHILRKASYRLPALADLAVLRFNTRGTASERGRSEGQFGDGEAERHDVAAADRLVRARPGLPRLWLLGWSFGTELALLWGNDPAVEGAILLSPPLRRAGDAELDAWAASGKPLAGAGARARRLPAADEARARFARVPQAELIAVERAKHLWVGEPSVRIVLGEIVRRVNPAAWPLPDRVEGPTVTLFDLTRKEGLRHRRVPRHRAGDRGRRSPRREPMSRWWRAARTGWPPRPSRSPATGGRRYVIRADVTGQEAVEARSPPRSSRLGHVDIVVNNAGGSNFVVPFLDLRLPGWDKMMRLNLTSAMYVCHAIGRHLASRGQGSVINVASVAGLVGSPTLSPYGAAKAGLISLTKTLAVEWAALGIRVNALCPGWTATDLNREPVGGRGRRAGHRSPRCRCGGGAGPRRWPARPSSWPATRRPT